MKLEAAKQKKRVLVAGGGPAGMEFALTAAGRGHDVILFEADGRLGGQVNLAKVPPGKGEFQKITDSMYSRMKRAGVDIRLNTQVTPKLVKDVGPEVLVIATGAIPIDIKVPGIDKPHVVSAWDVLNDEIVDYGKDIVIIGGSATGCETAHYISAMDVPDADTFTFLMYHNAEEPDSAMELLHKISRNITVIDMVERLADNVGRTARWSLMKSLRSMGVDLRPKTRLLEIKDDEVMVETDRGRESIPADQVIIAVGSVPLRKLEEEIKGNGIEIISIGDAKDPRKITDAVREGFEEALKI